MCSDSGSKDATNGASAQAASNARLSGKLEGLSDQAITSSNALSDKYAGTFEQLIAQASAQAKQAASMSDEQWNTYKTSGLPAIQKVFDTAMNYDTADRRNAEAAQAQNDVQSQADATGATLDRNMASRGVDPTSGNAVATRGLMSVQTAGQKAAAGNLARKQVENTGINLVNNAAGQATTLGNSALTTGQGANSSASTGAGLVQAQQGLKTQGLATAGSLLGSAVNANSSAGNLNLGVSDSETKNSGSQTAGIANIGSAAGSLVSAFKGFSSKKLKTKVSSLSDAKVAGMGGDDLKGVNRLNVDAWQYKPGVPDIAASDKEGQTTHVGPYAEDTQREFGDQVAPGGKMIDMQQAMQVNQRALVQLLSEMKLVNKRIAKLQAEDAREVA